MRDLTFKNHANVWRTALYGEREGMENDMQYCTVCVQPDTRPNTEFIGGVCPACHYLQASQSVDWASRLTELLDVTRPYRGNGRHDCVIGVSGGKDSTRQSVWVREKLHMNPLLVCVTYPPRISTDLGMRNLANLVSLGFDLEMIQPAPETSRRMMRFSFERFGNLLKATEVALFSGVQRLAVERGIPLIFWGENPALQVGDMAALGINGWDGNQLRNMNTLEGGDLTWLKSGGYTEQDLRFYRIPTLDEMSTSMIQIVYLGWAMGDWSLVRNGAYGGLLGVDFRTDDPMDTSDPYGITALDEDLTPINQMIKYFKFGFGRGTDYANDQIRAGRISREQGIELAERLDGRCSTRFIQAFCDYVHIEEMTFWDIVKDQVNRRLFDVDDVSRPRPKFKVGVGLL